MFLATVDLRALELDLTGVDRVQYTVTDGHLMLDTVTEGIR
ncbi:hypothetical protein [Halococcus saccharolyticus]|nr:hypothetical protein [Halococcus saccharolyticus]